MHRRSGCDIKHIDRLFMVMMMASGLMGGSCVSDCIYDENGPEY